MKKPTFFLEKFLQSHTNERITICAAPTPLWLSCSGQHEPFKALRCLARWQCHSTLTQKHKMFSETARTAYKVGRKHAEQYTSVSLHSHIAAFASRRFFFFFLRNAAYSLAGKNYWSSSYPENHTTKVCATLGAVRISQNELLFPRSNWSTTSGFLSLLISTWDGRLLRRFHIVAFSRRFWDATAVVWALQ